MAISIIEAERGSGLQDSLEETIMRTQESSRWTDDKTNTSKLLAMACLYNVNFDTVSGHSLLLICNQVQEDDTCKSQTKSKAIPVQDGTEQRDSLIRW